jgi:hypothetical protein
MRSRYVDIESMRRRGELSDRELGDAYWSMGVGALLGCLVASVGLLVVIGPAERPPLSDIDYAFRQRWTWMNELSPLFLGPFAGTLLGGFFARRIVERRDPFGLNRSASGRLGPYYELLLGLPVAGAAAGALAFAVVNPGPGLVSAGAGSQATRYRDDAAFQGVGALILTGASIGLGLGLLLTGVALRRRAARGATTPRSPVRAAGSVCWRMGLCGLAGLVAGAVAGWLLFGLADRPLELVRDRAPASIEQWDWLNEGRHVLVGASVGLFAGLIAGRLLASRALRAAGLDGMPFGPLGTVWRWLLALPVVATVAAFVVYEMQNPDNVFDATLPIVMGILFGLSLALLVAGARLRRT